MQRFEFTLELGWNALKDYLQANGAELLSVTPRSVVKAAFAARLIVDGQVWEDMLQWSNWLSHRYDEALLNEGVDLIHDCFLTAFQDLSSVFERLEEV